MPQTRPRRRSARNRGARAELAQVAPRPALKPVRGLKVKTVSAMTLAFSLLCLAAFAASRPPLPSGRSTGAVTAATEHPTTAKHAKTAARPARAAPATAR
jgi:hypothetical protein